MVRDAGDLYEVGPDAPELEGAVMLHYLDGFIDAGAAGRLFTAHLLGSLEHKAVVTFDADRLIDYRSRRPPMTFEQDRAAIGFAVHVPHYLAQAAYPAAAVTLLESVTRATGLSLPDEALRAAARRTDEEIGRQVEASEEIAELVQALERQYDAFVDAASREGLLTDEAGNVPTAEELGAQ